VDSTNAVASSPHASLFANLDDDRGIGEGMVLVYKSELVHGVLDKSAFGNSSKMGLVHSIYELYGAKVHISSLGLFSIKNLTPLVGCWRFPVQLGQANDLVHPALGAHLRRGRPCIVILICGV